MFLFSFAHPRKARGAEAHSPTRSPLAMAAETASTMSHDEVNLAWRDVTYDVPVKVKVKPVKQSDVNNTQANNTQPSSDGEYKRILHGLSGHVRAGQVVAVMGPSGSGKTSLIHVLGGRRESGVSGSFVVNGEVYPNTRSLLGDLGYVTQEDVLLNSLTTKETLMFATRLRLAGRKVHGDETGKTKSRAKAIEEIVERAIHDFDLSRAANSHVGVVGQGGISGGEKRRLVIAMECVHRPKLLLLDEPTSGLDATTALLVCNKLRDIANGEQGSGHRAAVVTSIHQPRSSIMPLFDQCVLLADGREVYAGPTYETNPDGSLTTGGVMGWLAEVGYRCPMFESPPDFLLDLINTRVDEPDVNAVEGDGATIDDAVEGGGAAIRDRSAMVRELTEWWAVSERRRAFLADGDAIKQMRAERHLDISGEGDNNISGARHWAVAWMARYDALFGRTFLFKLREPSGVATQAVNSVIMPLIIGSLYYDTPLTVSGAADRLRAISLIVLIQSFSAFDQLLLFPKERGLYLHESNGGMYPTSAYYASRSLVELVTIVLFALTSACISYEMFGLNDGSGAARVEFYMMIVAVTVAGASFLTMIGTMCKSFEQTNAVAATTLIVLMLFDGNWINRRNIPVYYRWLPEVSFLGYAVEGAVASDFKRHTFVCTERAVAEEGCVPLTGNQYLRMLDFDPDSTWPMFWLLVLVTACYRVVAFFALHFLWTGQTYAERWAKLVHYNA